MNLSQLRYFKKLVEVRHYSRAARELFITQPTLSGAISSLEKELAVVLFERDRRSVVLTPKGEVFYEHVCLALHALEDGVAAVQEGSTASLGSVDVGMIFTSQDDYFPTMIRDYRALSNDTVTIRTHQGFTGMLVDGLRKGTLDVAFCGDIEGEADIVFYPLAYRSLVLCVRDDSPLAQRERVSFDDIRDLHLATYRKGTSVGEKVRLLLEENEVEDAEQAYDDDISMASHVSFGSGREAALMLDSLGMRLFDNLRAVKVEEIPKRFYWINLAYNTKHSRSRAVEGFIQFVKSYQGNDEYVQK